ncbi:MAG TPA: DinB family protein [Pseudonocardiaceae bacterium]|nr:DinB family protein [Pseudonocardiaceae bacterium]
MTTTEKLTGERADLLESLTKQRFFLKFTAREMSEEQIRQHSTVSQLTLGVLIKHVTDMERQWVSFILEGPSAIGDFGDELTPEQIAAWAAGWELAEDVTLADLIAEYDKVAARTDELIASIDLDASHPLPRAPWFQPGSQWSARRVLMHLVAETAQHAGHADIIRESIDGAKSMG